MDFNILLRNQVCLGYDRLFMGCRGGGVVAGIATGPRFTFADQRMPTCLDAWHAHVKFPSLHNFAVSKSRSRNCCCETSGEPKTDIVESKMNHFSEPIACE